MRNDRNWSLFVLLDRRFFIQFRLFFLLFSIFYCIVGFVTTFNKFQVQSKIRLLQINVRIPIRLKIKLYAVFIEWGSRIYFLFLGRQDIVNYWDFPYKISRNGHKRLVLKTTRHDSWEVFEKISPRDHWFVLQILLDWLCLRSLCCYHCSMVFSESV